MTEKLTFPNPKSRSKILNWKRPEDYVPDYFLDQELHKKFPQRNHIIMRNEVKDFYYKDLKIKERRRLKREYNEMHGIEEDDSIEEYLEDKLQGRIYKKFYQFVEDNYEYVICPLKDKVKEENINNDNIIISEKKVLSPSEIILKEKSTDFIKWISSIFQTINDTNITDYLNVNNLFNISVYNKINLY